MKYLELSWTHPNSLERAAQTNSKFHLPQHLVPPHVMTDDVNSNEKPFLPLHLQTSVHASRAESLHAKMY